MQLLVCMHKIKFPFDFHAVRKDKNTGQKRKHPECTWKDMQNHIQMYSNFTQFDTLLSSSYYGASS